MPNSAMLLSVGVRYNKLTVIEPPHKIGQRWYCTCRCDCGKIINTRVDGVIGGGTKSCGCIRGESHIKDLTGQKFNNITVLEFLDIVPRRGSRWRCRCDCGKETIAYGSALQKGDKKTCGACSYNIYTEHGDYIEGTVPSGEVFYFDTADLPKVQKYKWMLDKNGYVVSTSTKPQLKLHRYLLDFPAGIEIDHININPSDNRRRNLRLATHSQNSQNSPLRRDNTSGYRGVYFDKRRGDWYARIQADKKEYNLGYYATAKEAALIRDRAAFKLHGEFAWLNFPDKFSNDI